MSDIASEDPRFDYIKYTVLKLLDVDDSYWKELIWKEESQTTVKDFLDTPTAVLLLFFLDENRKLLLSLELPSSRYTPSMIGYFFKNTAIVSTEKYKQEIIFGNISNFPLSQYQDLFEKVLHPMFSNPSNNSRWPAEIANDIILHFEDFKKTLTYHIGLAQGKTTLVIPEMAKMIENFNVDEITSDHNDCELHSVINKITEMLCDWIPIIKEVLAVTSESILLKVEQGPETEITFWKDRKNNLEFIQNQLNDEVIEKMVLALEKTNNNHFPLFKNFLQEVLEALTEANEISDSLSSMLEVLQKLKICEFPSLKEHLPEAMKTITSSWTNSKYFNKVPSRISILIKKSCFFLIEKVENYLNPSNIFKDDECKMREKLKTSIETCNVFLKAYSDCREMYSNGTSMYPWEFPDQRLFNAFKSFLDRLNKIYEIFEASALYRSISDFKILGIQQVPFKIRLDELSNTFKENYKVFIETSSNPLDLKSNVFLEEYNLFSLRLDELDNKLGSTLSQACMSCVTSEDSFKLMNLIQDLLKRPLVNLEFKKLITSLLRNIYMELLAAKEIYDKLLLVLESSTPVIYKNLPTISGELQWSMDLQKKLSFPIDSLQTYQHYYINIEDADLILRTYKEIDELLKNFQNEIFSKWEVALDVVKKQLDEPLFYFNDTDTFLLNFPLQILDIAEEIQYIKMIKKSDLLPSNALEYHNIMKKVLPAHSMLACTIQWYNDLSQNLTHLEKVLIEHVWNKAFDDLKKGVEEKWTKNDLQEYAEKVYMTMKSLYEKVNQAKENVRNIQQHIDSWNNSPVLTRDSPDSLVHFQMFMITPKMRQQTYNVIETASNLNRSMEENLLLLESDPESREWKNYVEYLDSIMETGLKESVKCSLQYLLDNTDGQNKKLVPFYKVEMILKEDISFVPLLDRNKIGSIFQLFETVVEIIYSPASAIKCLANIEIDYLKAISEDAELNKLKDKVIQQIESGISKILAQKENYKRYSDLWLQDIDTVLEDFVLYGPLPDTKTDEENLAAAELSLEMKPPTEEEFRTQIAQFDMLLKKIEDLQSETTVESWLLLDIASFKESLSSLIKNWCSAYKTRLIELKSQGKLRSVEEDGD